MSPRKSARPLGRADHNERVAATVSELDKMLRGIANDLQAGPWAAWAVKLLKSDEATTPSRLGDRPGGTS